MGPEVRILFNSGDLYLPSEKAMGTDSNKTSILTIKHGAFKDTFMHIDKGHNRTPDGHPVVTYTADDADPACATLHPPTPTERMHHAACTMHHAFFCVYPSKAHRASCTMQHDFFLHPTP